MVCWEMHSQVTGDGHLGIGHSGVGVSAIGCRLRDPGPRTRHLSPEMIFYPPTAYR